MGIYSPSRRPRPSEWYHTTQNHLGHSFGKAHINFSESILKPYAIFLKNVFSSAVHEERALNLSEPMLSPKPNDATDHIWQTPDPVTEGLNHSLFAQNFEAPSNTYNDTFENLIPCPSPLGFDLSPNPLSISSGTIPFISTTIPDSLIDPILLNTTNIFETPPTVPSPLTAPALPLESRLLGINSSPVVHQTYSASPIQCSTATLFSVEPESQVQVPSHITSNVFGSLVKNLLSHLAHLPPPSC
ncbi:hypothetical protein BDZ94DRAFT_1057810 [Collybia nuda]|uniref:Uncharacterized protein n=1 Tax=Collybia nuda TaxID=64659 RepID=A0A9P5XZ18_9AGAR|nr:hypothetical protein BDZ94DRAFT_1057810 [Collybia nuda]